MSAPASSLDVHPRMDLLHTGFLALLPRIQLHAEIFFRHLRCPHKKDDAIAETIALSWQWYRRLIQQGRDAAAFVSALAGYAARAVYSGRRLSGMEKAKDVLSPRAQRRHGFAVDKLPERGTVGGNLWDEALQDNTHSPVPDQVCFRCDFPTWRSTRADRDRRMIDDLMTGNRTRDEAARFGLTESRVSQLRREFFTDWSRFNGESAEETPT